MATELGGRLGLSEQELREKLSEELERALRNQGGEWSADAIAHSVARILHLDHLRMLEQLEAAGMRLADDAAQGDDAR
jgi:hypothetical protein